jgi:vacuolar protein sorting-associated protein 35
VIQDLIELIQAEKQSDNTVADPSTEAFFASTLRYIEFQKQKGGSIVEKYEQIKTI